MRLPLLRHEHRKVDRMLDERVLVVLRPLRFVRRSPVRIEKLPSFGADRVGLVEDVELVFCSSFEFFFRRRRLEVDVFIEGDEGCEEGREGVVERRVGRELGGVSVGDPRFEDELAALDGFGGEGSDGVLERGKFEVRIESDRDVRDG